MRGGGPDGPVAVISHAFWQRRFGGAGDTIGRQLTIEGVPFTVVGVLPPEFFGIDVGRSLDVVVPVGMLDDRPAGATLEDRDYWWLQVMVRLKTGQSADQATAALRALQPQIRNATLPADWASIDLEQYLREPFTLAPAANGSSPLRRRYERPLLTIMVVVVLVLLIACANIANLLLARATARRHEWSVRLALGASRWRLVRLLLTESLLLSASGAAVGFLIARWGSDLLVRQLSVQGNAVFLDLSLDWRVLMFTTGTTVITTLLFGVAPAFRAAGVSPIEAIKEHGRGTGGQARRMSLASTLVVVQVALSVVLVVAAGLFLRTFNKLATLDLGFDPSRVLVVAMNAEQTPIDPAQRMAVFERARQAVATLPGVQSAALSYVTPVSGHNWANRFEVSDGLALDRLGAQCVSQSGLRRVLRDLRPAPRRGPDVHRQRPQRRADGRDRERGIRAPVPERREPDRPHASSIPASGRRSRPWRLSAWSTTPCIDGSATLCHRRCIRLRRKRGGRCRQPRSTSTCARRPDPRRC